jgi:2-polyprenyl-3-methyl-5-hydroxy-6-metoxy-1,4-benzoquinol methylase
MGVGAQDRMLVAAADTKEGWPEHGLERVGCCPACGAAAREPLHADLTDRMFGCAPGTWNLSCCLRCGSAYLDPRPTEETVVLAYSDYFTHADAVARPAVPLGRFRAALANGYLNKRYRARLRPASRLGPAIVPLFPLRRVRTDREVRHLIRPEHGGTLLDVGCGNGDFLLKAERAGWRALGVDLDPRAVASCRRAGLAASEGTIETVDIPPASLDAVGFAHVLEHLHQPRRALARARDLLRPGGLLWLATPNLSSAGHAHFGADWLGLDPPRHLVVFTRRALEALVVQTGFEIVARPAASFTAWIYLESALLAAGGRPSAATRLRARLTDATALVRPERSEELLLVARRPDSRAGGKE